MNNDSDVLIIDDDKALTKMLSLYMQENDLSAKSVHTISDAINSDAQPKLILLDHHLPDMLGLAALPQLKEKFPAIPILMMTGKHDMTLAIDAIKAGAADYIHKPLDESILQAAIDKHLKTAPDKNAIRTVKSMQESDTPHIIGTSPAILEVIKTVAIASQNDATVFIQGESGTGKEVVAKAIHQHSGKKGDFVGINCSAVVSTLLESELFGHEKGAFTGATERKEGKFIHAQDGTLFLDEIGDMEPQLQSKLLRVLQENSLERVGGNETLKTNARIIAATHKNIDQMIQDDKFREDLYYRLKVIVITLPPLKDRLEDLQLLVPFLMNRVSQKVGKEINSIQQDVWELLYAHNWPGNIRELENALMRAIATCPGDTITKDLFSLGQHSPTGGNDKQESQTNNSQLMTLAEMEKQHIAHVLKATRGHKGKASVILDISRPALNRKIEKYDI
jgi:DNA-binding NtrC family response regulator